MSLSMALAVLAAVAAGAALLEVARVPPRPRPHGRLAAPWARNRAGRRGTRGRDGGGTAAEGSGGPARWAAVGRVDVRLEALLDAAGRAAVPDAAALAVRARLGALIGGAWGGAAGVMVAPLWLAVGIGLAGAAGGRWLPTALLRRAGAARRVRLADECPEVLDLLAVAFGCGLPARAALVQAARWSVGEVSVGVARAADELARGAAVAPTLARLVREYPAPELDAAVAILARSRLHGTAAAAPLRALAEGARHARARRAMEHAARAAPRVQLVAALLLVPAALCVLAASLVAGGVG